jgi:hypothetical protein
MGGVRTAAVLATLLERLRNENTRVQTLRVGRGWGGGVLISQTFAQVAGSALKIDLTPVLKDLVSEGCLFLRKVS